MEKNWKSHTFSFFAHQKKKIGTNKSRYNCPGPVRQTTVMPLLGGPTLNQSLPFEEISSFLKSLKCGQIRPGSEIKTNFLPT